MRSALLLLLTVLPLWAAAQEPSLKPTMGHELWISMGVAGRAPKFMKKPLGDHYNRIRLSGEAGYRSTDGFFVGKQVYTDLAARYKLTKWLSLGTEYRYALRIQSADRQRITFQVRSDRSFGRFDLEYRGGFQMTFLENDRQNNLIRNKFSVEYRIPNWKLDPEFSVEFFTRTNDPIGWYLSGTRYKLGTSWSPRKGYSISPSVLYNTDGMVSYPENRMGWSIDLGIDLRKR